MRTRMRGVDGFREIEAASTRINMKFEFSAVCFRLTLEFFWLGPPPVFRRYRIMPQDAAVRRRLLRMVRERLKE